MRSSRAWSFVGSGYDIHTAKISGADGSVLWGPVSYDSGAGDYPDRIATSPSGDVLVIGHSDSDGYPNLALKYSGVDGSLLWGPIIHGRGQPSGIAVDAAGDLFEEGSSGITTTKFSGATGAILWGPVTAGDVFGGYGSWLALDASGERIRHGQPVRAGHGLRLRRGQVSRQRRRRPLGAGDLRRRRGAITRTASWWTGPATWPSRGHSRRARTSGAPRRFRMTGRPAP